MNSTGAKRSPMKKCSQILDSSMHKATCSSVLKDSKFPELQSGGSDSEGISAMKVCTYSYCSIHGNRHSDLTPSKSLVSTRRRLSKTQKSTKMESQSFHRAKRSSNTKKGMQAGKMDCLTDMAVVEPAHKRRAITSIRKMASPKDDLNGEGTHGREYKDSRNSESVDENLHLYLKEKLQISEFWTAERSVLEPCLLRDKSKEYCADKKEEGIVASTSHKRVLPADHPEHTNIISQKVEDPGQWRDMLPYDDITYTCHEEIPVDGKVHQDVNEDRISSLNFDVYKIDAELNTSEATTSTRVANADKKEEGTVASNSLKCVLPADHSEHTDIILQKVEDPGQWCDMLPFDENTYHEEIPVDEKVHHDVNEDRISSLNFDVYKIDSELNTSEATTSTSAANADKKEEGTVASNSHKCVLPADHPEHTDIILQKVEDPGQWCDMLPFDENTYHEEIPVDGKVHQDVNEDRISSLNFDVYKIDSELNTSDATTSTSAANADKKEEGTVASNSHKCVLPADHPEHTDIILQKVEDPGQWCDMLPFDDITYNCHEGIPVDGKVHQDVSEGRISSLNFDEYATDSELNTSEATTSTIGANAYKKGEGIVASNSHKCVLPADHPEHTNIILQKVEDPGQWCDMLPFDDVTYTCHEEIPVDGKVYQDVKEDRVSSLNFDVYKVDSELNTSEATASTSVAKEPIDKSRSLSTKAFVESSAINDMISSASVSQQLDEQTADSKGKNEDPVQDYQFPSRDSEPDCNSLVVEKIQMEKQKHMGLWNLIYHHMVSRIASDDEMQPPLNKMDEEEQGEGENTLPGIGEGMEVYDHDRGSHKIQLYQHNAIKLLREALDEILSEIPDLLSDDQSINNNSNSDKGGKNHDASGELRMSNSSDSGEESMVQDLEAMRHKEDNINGPEGDKAQSNIVSKSKQQPPKSWSNLKKIIILKRFVKALEKVRNFNPQESRHVVQPEHGANEIHPRHQTMEDRKNSERMLDYALQHVISKLAPDQKRKAALLVQAFGTVVPLVEPGTSPRSSVSASSHASPVQTATASSYEKGSRKRKETNFGISLHKSSCPDMIYKDDQDQVCDSTKKEGIPESCFELNEPSSESGFIHSAPSILTFESTSANLKESFGALNPCNSDHNYNAKDNDPDTVSYCLVEPREAAQTERGESSRTATAEDQDTLTRIELIMVQIEQKLLQVEQDISQIHALLQLIVSLLPPPAPQ